jgi:hypothetical protein
MKIPSLTKLPKNKRFYIQPRYYDPVKEDIENRVSRIKAELKLPENDHYSFSSKLSGVFERRRTQSQQSNVLQMVIFLLLSGLVAGYLFFGNNVFFVFLILIPLYFYFRLKNFSKRDQS